jgi:hypothetical protein
VKRLKYLLTSLLYTAPAITLFFVFIGVSPTSIILSGIVLACSLTPLLADVKFTKHKKIAQLILLISAPFLASPVLSLTLGLTWWVPLACVSVAIVDVLTVYAMTFIFKTSIAVIIALVPTLFVMFHFLGFIGLVVGLIEFAPVLFFTVAHATFDMRPEPVQDSQSEVTKKAITSDIKVSEYFVLVVQKGIHTSLVTGIQTEDKALATAKFGFKSESGNAADLYDEGQWFLEKHQLIEVDSEVKDVAKFYYNSFILNEKKYNTLLEVAAKLNPNIQMLDHTDSDNAVKTLGTMFSQIEKDDKLHQEIFGGKNWIFSKTVTNNCRHTALKILKVVEKKNTGISSNALIKPSGQKLVLYKDGELFDDTNTKAADYDDLKLNHKTPNYFKRSLAWIGCSLVASAAVVGYASFFTPSVITIGSFSIAWGIMAPSIIGLAVVVTVIACACAYGRKTPDESLDLKLDTSNSKESMQSNEISICSEKYNSPHAPRESFVESQNPLTELETSTISSQMC